MRVHREPRKWTFGLLWILGNTLGWGLFLVLGWAAAWLVWELYDLEGYRLLSNEETRGLITYAVAGFWWGAIVGGFQQFVLTRRFELEGSKWTWVTIIGLTLHAVLGGLVSLFVVILSYSSLSFYILNSISALVPPLALGIAQWCVLRQYFARSGWWIAVTVLALWLPTVASPIFAGGHGMGSIASFIVPLLVRGFVYGVLTWIALVVISRQSIAAGESD